MVTGDDFAQRLDDQLAAEAVHLERRTGPAARQETAGGSPLAPGTAGTGAPKEAGSGQLGAVETPETAAVWQEAVAGGVVQAREREVGW